MVTLVTLTSLALMGRIPRVIGCVVWGCQSCLSPSMRDDKVVSKAYPSLASREAGAIFFFFFFPPVACTVLVCKMKVLNRMTIMVLLNAKFLWVTFWLCVSSSTLFEACLWQYLEVKGCRISLSRFGHRINNHSSLIPGKKGRTPLGVQGPYS